ncbi:MAG: LysR family transcriptional regulator substrate-binding protein, partial [Terriglobales bacterium]
FMYVLPKLFATYCSKYPTVQVTVYRNFSYKIIEKLESGALDAGIVTLPVKSPNLKAHTIFRDRLMLMVSAENPLAGRKSVTAEDVAGQPLILPTRGYTRRLMEKLLHPHASKLQIRMELASVGVIKSFVAANIGVTLLSESFARDEVRAGRVKLIPLRDAELWRELGLVYRTNRVHTRAVSSFISTVREVANDLRSGPAAPSAR